MLRRVSIENFKGIGPRIDIDLKPVTLLFGPNSVGKSTILHAIHYVHAVLESGHPEVGQTRLGGDLDLGGFKAFVHDHDLESTVTVGFEFDVKVGGAMTVAGNFVGQDVTAVGVEFQVQWSSLLDRPQVSRYLVSINGEALAEIGTTFDGANVWLTNINRSHPLLASSDVEGEVASNPRDDAQIGCLPGRKMALPILGKSLMIGGKERQLPIDTEERDRKAISLRDDPSMPDESDSQMSFDDIQMRHFEREKSQEDPEETELRVIDNLMTSAGQALRDQLERFRYVGPLRQAPPRNYRPPERSDEARWAGGLGAWDALMRSRAVRATVSDWLRDDERLATSYSIDLQSYRELDDATFLVLQRAAQDFELDETFLRLTAHLPRRERLVVIDNFKDLPLAPCDLGEGIAQVVPVIAAAIGGHMTTASGTKEAIEIVAIEQPELHIHPRMQVVLGDLFLSYCEDLQFFIETHSEHLMLRLLRRIRETTEDTLPENAPSATVDTVAVLYVEQVEGRVALRPLRIGADGEFKDAWPEGFFDERFEEVY